VRLVGERRRARQANGSLGAGRSRLTLGPGLAGRPRIAFRPLRARFADWTLRAALTDRAGDAAHSRRAVDEQRSELGSRRQVGRLVLYDKRRHSLALRPLLSPQVKRLNG
jgi:hypothetical protein